MNDRAAGRSLPAAARRPTVLVIDDDASVLGVVQLLLDHLGFASKLAPSSTVARSALATGGSEIELILLDSLMPEVEGPQTLAELRPLAPATPVIVMSGNLDEAAAEAFGRLGVKVFLPKPFGLQELSAALRAAR